MSLQLAVYPQYKNGYSFTTVPNQDELVADGILFNTLPLDTSHGTTDGSPANDALNSDPANSNWKKYHTLNGNGWAFNAHPTLFGNTKTMYGTPTQNGVVFKSNSANGDVQSGIYQEIQNLKPLQDYDLVIEVSSANNNNGFFVLGVDGRSDTLGGGDFTNLSTNAGTITYPFQAQSTEETLMLSYYPSSTNNVSIESISIKESLANPTFTYSDLYDGQNLLDLKDFNSIPLSLSVDDFKNTTEKIQSYSKDFSLPATKNNNKIFYNLFDVTVSVKDKVKTFNPLMQTKAKLSQDGIVIFEGFLKLTDIKFVDGNHEYTVHLYTDLISLSDTLKDRKFKDLDFSELNHDYTATNISNSWSGDLFLSQNLTVDSFAFDGTHYNRTSALKYPFVDWTGNLDDSNGRLDLNHLEDAYRPFIKVKYLFDNIMKDAGFRYDSQFLDLPRFTNLYMDFNFGEGIGGALNIDTNFSEAWDGSIDNYAQNNSWTTVIFNQESVPNAATFYNTSTSTFTATENNQLVVMDIKFQVKNDDYLAQRNFSTRLIHTDAAGTITQYDKQDYLLGSGISNNDHKTINFNESLTLNVGDTLNVQFKSFSNGGATDVLQMKTNHTEWNSNKNYWDFNQVSSGGVKAQDLLDTARGDIGQWEFVKSLFNMFNLIATPDPLDSKSFKIEPYNDIFLYNSDSKTHDWTLKENRGQHTIKSLELLKTTKFSYKKDDKDYVSKVYSAAFDNNYLYGTQEYDASGLTILRGEKTIDAGIFAPTPIKPLSQANSGMIIPSIYESKEEGTENQAYSNKPRILYDCGTTTGNIPYSSPVQNDPSDYFDNKYSYLVFSHYSQSPATSNSFDLNFGTCEQINEGYSTVKSLYNEYWAAYFDELHHVDTKVVETEVMLSASDLSMFNFYDKVILRNREYRVNKIDYKPNSMSKVELILIP